MGVDVTPLKWGIKGGFIHNIAKFDEEKISENENHNSRIDMRV
jgi:hypothetical protein